MHIHRVLGSNLREALKRAQELHGEDAVVVGQEMAANGDITVAVAKRSARASAPAPRAQPVKPDPALREVVTRLRRHGATEGFVARIVEGMAARNGDARHALDLAADAIGALFPPLSFPRARGKARVLALVGPAGAGKTTTTGKLAAQIVHAGRRIELATLDARRPGAVEHLRAWATWLSTPFTVLQSGAELTLSSIAGSDLILVDTSGRPAEDGEKLDRIRAACGAAGVAFDVYIVLPASSSWSALDQARASFAPLRPSGAIVTKIDETHEPAPALESALDAALPLAFLCNGSDMQSLHRATGGIVADVLLCGRIG
jgi:flagellar biosynthesis GTPase FlhF